MSLIVEAALSAFFQAIFDKIASSDLLRFFSDNQVHAEVHSWKNMLLTIRHVLDDAEEKQINKPAVKDWLTDLNDLAYDVDDILDEFATDSLRRKWKGEADASTSQVRKLLTSCCVCFSSSSVMFNSQMASKIKDISNRLQAVKERAGTLELKKHVGEISATAWQRPPSTCLHDEPQVYGRNDDKRKILRMLLKDDSSNEKLCVLPIVGMGGLGKTTLARYVYNDESLQINFHPKAWVCVSDDFDIMRITKAILESITKRPCDLKELNAVQLQLQKELAGKKFLIVLDDVWSERYQDWNALRPPFMNGASGCRIIVTTRSEEVAKKMGTVAFYTLERICDEDCWMLFRSHALENTTTSTLQNPETIRTKVIDKCAGLPLAARTLGGLLRSKPIEKWEDILNSKIWSLEGERSDVLPVLRLSYYHLPSHLKRCFSYCAIFPKDYEFTEMEVVLLWMAEGLIQRMGDVEQMEDAGMNHFHDLLSRSLFQRASNEGSKFVMHDLVNDLAQSVAGETCLRLEDDRKHYKRERVRHFSYIRSPYDGIKKFQLLHEIPKIRTLLPLSLQWVIGYHMTSDFLTNLLPELRCLRALSFKGYDIYELPESIGELEHLRYLDLSFTAIRSLPKSTISLCNLQTLLLRFCRNLKKLPPGMVNLKNLSYLDIEGTGLDEGLPLGVKELVSLRRLSEFPVGSKVSEAGLTDLNRLNLLQGRLRISGLEKVTNSVHGKEAKLKEKKYLKDLLLIWKNDEGRDERLDKEILDGLQPHAELEKLHLENYGGVSFPHWVGEPAFNKLVFLRLMDCRKCSCLPSLGLLPSLRELSIKGMSSVKSIGSESYGEGCSNPFPALETLRFENMAEWEDWNPGEFEFPCLNELTIRTCPTLKGKLPSCLTKLKKLEIEDCGELIVCLPSLPAVLRLKIRVCKEVDFRNMAEFGSPNVVQVRSISKFTIETEGLMEKLCKSKELEVDELFPRVEVKERMVSHLETLHLYNCESFLHFAHYFMSLRELFIVRYPELISLQGISLPSSLREIQIQGCEALVSLNIDICLEKLKIEGCNSLMSMGRGISKLLSTLKSLEIRDCQNFRSLLLDEDRVSCSSTVMDDYSYFMNLEFLSVEHCPSLTSLTSSRGDLPPILKHLKIRDCSALQSIAETFNTSTFLEIIQIRKCCNLRFLPKDLHRLVILQQIDIVDCEKLEALPENIHNIAYLQVLCIGSLPSITSFPKEGLPTNLTKLNISDPIICKQLFEWGLHKLTNLTYLEISGCPDMISFPCNDIGMVLPPTLTSLGISDFPKLRYISTEGFQNLTSLEYLFLGDCPELTSFQKKGLPLSLLILWIRSCPLMKERCRKDKGQEWLKIKHIPCVLIDDWQSVFDPDFSLVRNG